jgi:hypothetical protein
MVYLLALIVVLVVSTVAVVMAAGAGSRLRAQDDALGKAVARQAALGVLRAVVNDLSTAQTSGLQPSLLTVLPEGETIGDCRVVLIGRDPAGNRQQFALIPESGRISLGALTDTSVPQQLRDRLRDALTALPGMSVEITAAIVDWGDEDDLIDEDGGAERGDSAYQGAAVPYAPRNARFETIDELRLVRGVTDTVFFGEDLNTNGRLDVGEDANGNGRLDPGLRELVTIESREPATSSGGDTLSNVNNAGERTQLFTDLFDSTRAAELALEATNAGGQFANRLHFLASLDLSDSEIAALWPRVTVRTGGGGPGGGGGGAQDPVGRVGLVDAWSCHESVLVALVGADIAGKIMGARPTTMPAGPGWLVHALAPAEAVTAGMALTSGSYQFRADILAVSGDGAGWCRLDARIDCVTGYPRVTALRSADALGWPFPGVSREHLRRAGGPDQLASLLSADRN